MGLLGSDKSKTEKKQSMEEKILGDGVRVPSKAPKGFSKKVMTDVPVAGVTYHQLQVMDFIKGKDREIDLRPTTVVVLGTEMPATAVYGSWAEGKKRTEAHIGYLPEEVHSSVAHLSVAAVLVKVFMPVAGRSAGLRLDIYAR